MLEVYYLKLSDLLNIPEDFLEKQVSEETAQVVKKYQNKRVRITKLAGESMLRHLLLTNFQLKTEDYSITKGEHGKPFITGTDIPIFFNISHSGNYIICAISNHEVGIDIEYRGTAKLQIAHRFFHPAEACKLENTPDTLKNHLFFNYWSVKESFLKYIGTGLSGSLSNFEVIFSDQDIWIKKGHSRLDVTIHECPIDPEYSCFVCSQNNITPTIFPFAFLF